MAVNKKSLKNLDPVKDRKTAQERGRAGGYAAAKTTRRRKTLKEELLLLLANGNTQQNISVALIQQALDGNVKAFETIRDSIGEKPVDKVENTIKPVIKVTLEDDNDDE